MGRYGNVDYSELLNLEKNLEKLAKADTEAICEECAKSLAARLLALVIKRTPTGNYPAETGKVGGTLKRGWTASTDTTDPTKQAMYENLFGGNQRVIKGDIKVLKHGNIYIVIVKNAVSYAEYVEFGHRTRGGNGWVEGQFFLTESEEALKKKAPQILERIVTKRIGEAMRNAN